MFEVFCCRVSTRLTPSITAELLMCHSYAQWILHILQVILSTYRVSPDAIAFSFCNPFSCVCFWFPIGKFLSWVIVTSACPAVSGEALGLLLVNMWEEGMAYFGEASVEPLSSISKSHSPMFLYYAFTLLKDRRSRAVFPARSLNFPRLLRASTVCVLQVRRICSLTFDCILINPQTSSSLPYNISMTCYLMCLPSLCGWLPGKLARTSAASIMLSNEYGLVRQKVFLSFPF